MSEATERRGLPGLQYPEEYLHRIAGELAERFDGIFALETVERYVLESYTGLLRTASVKAHLAQTTVRFATDRLTALAQAKGALAHDVPEVLFVCEQNAGRSQMAAALTAAMSNGAVHVRSAGSMPSARLNPQAIAALRELNIDLTQEFPKPLTDDVVQAADVVVTMGCGDACAIYPGKRYLDWALEDPANLPIERVREIRDEIAAHVRELLTGLGVESKAI